MNCLNAILNSCQGTTDGICKLHLLTDKLHIKVDIMITAFEFQLAIKKVRNDRKCVPCIAKICSNVLCLKPNDRFMLIVSIQMNTTHYSGLYRLLFQYTQLYLSNPKPTIIVRSE